ncbi:MAG TPA: 3-hydroxyisobutyrate dehydrogenase [Hyphomicrobiaceae bacterium]|nr:3-hydroxyisobutyrate dehydrogenase [Hyphomicrobiaceae bacterium]
MARIGFIGLGNMGQPMAGNLVKAGHEVIGYDLLADRVERAKSRGVVAGGSAAEAASGAHAVITMLPAGKDTLAVYTGGVLSATQRGTLFFDCSTIDVASARSAHELARRSGMVSLDAPVSGGVAGAEAATLTFMVGGDKAAFDAGEPLLNAMGKRIVHCGEAGAGQAAKICNNLILGVSMIAVSEAFVLAEKLGVSAQALFEVASNSSGRCWALDAYCPVPGLVAAAPSNRGYKGGFASALMLKDLRLAREAARSAGTAIPLGAHAAELYRCHADTGHAAEDFSGIIKLIRGSNDV